MLIVVVSCVAVLAIAAAALGVLLGYFGSK
jgi:hypothetical protein